MNIEPPGSPRGATPESQVAVIAFLSDPASYGLPGCGVEQVQTHCSIVFLAGDRAYKLKRAIHFAALDYTTQPLRRLACEAELRLNRRTAPELYLAVLPITAQPDGTLAFNRCGPVLDHVVVMRRFHRNDLFACMAETGRLTPGLMRHLGTLIAQFHQAADVTPLFGGSEAMRREIVSNDRELAAIAPELDGAAVDRLSLGCHRLLDDLAPLLDRRRDAGRVRRCHGDLRLANICLYQGRPTLFDCIEFSDTVGCIDVLHDLAFLLMDLHLRGRNDLASAVFNAYLDVSPETDGLRVLPLFLAVRAATRSYALAASARRQPGKRQAARQRTLARRHIEAGLAFLAPPPPAVIVLGGPDRHRAELAAGIAGLLPPCPGARVLALSEQAWPDAVALATAGCSIVLHGDLADAADRRAAQCMTARIGQRWTGLWFGPVPEALDRNIWHPLETRFGSLGGLAATAALLGRSGMGIAPSP